MEAWRKIDRIVRSAGPGGATRPGRAGRFGGTFFKPALFCGMGSLRNEVILPVRPEGVNDDPFRHTPWPFAPRPPRGSAVARPCGMAIALLSGTSIRFMKRRREDASEGIFKRRTS